MKAAAGGFWILSCSLIIMAGIFLTALPDHLRLGVRTAVRFHQELEDARARESELETALQEIQNAMAAKHRIAGMVAMGRESLFEAAARFRDVDENRPSFNRTRFRSLLGGSDDERHCRQVLRYVGDWLEEHQPGKLDAVMDRLEAELRQCLERGGPLFLR